MTLYISYGSNFPAWSCLLFIENLVHHMPTNGSWLNHVMYSASPNCTIYSTLYIGGKHPTTIIYSYCIWTLAKHSPRLSYILIKSKLKESLYMHAQYDMHSVWFLCYIDTLRSMYSVQLCRHITM